MNTANRAEKSKDEIALAYRSEPWWYDVRGFFILTFAYNSTLSEQLRFFSGNFGARHLEVACGTGTLLELVLQWRRWKKLPKVQVVGVDYAETMLAGARHRFAGKPGFEFIHGDVAELPFQEGAFDTANVANAVHCFPDVDGSLRGVYTVLKPGGTMAANVLLFPRRGWPWRQMAERINRWGVRKGILVTPYTREDIRRRILAAGFEIIQERVSGNCFNVLARKPGA